MISGRIIDRIDAIDANADFSILSPHLAGLSAELADLAGSLPIGSANTAALNALDNAQALEKRRVHAGILAVDPLVPGIVLFEALAAHGIAGVVNLPTVGLASGEFARVLDEAGCDYAAELKALSRAQDFGLEVAAFVFSYDHAARARALGIDTLILHPGLVSRDRNTLTRLAEGAETVIKRLKADISDVQILLYKHPAFGASLAAAGHRADGTVTWHIDKSDSVSPGAA